MFILRLQSSDSCLRKFILHSAKNNEGIHKHPDSDNIIKSQINLLFTGVGWSAAILGKIVCEGLPRLVCSFELSKFLLRQFF